MGTARGPLPLERVKEQLGVIEAPGTEEELVALLYQTIEELIRVLLK